MPTAHIELNILTDPSLFDELVALMTPHGVDGYWEDGNLLRAYIRSDIWSPALLSRLRETANTLARAHGMEPPRISFGTIKPQNWNEEWEAGIKPIQVTNRIVIVPSWHTGALPPGDIIITIDPKMSFGTGYHETTRLMLGLLETHVAPGAVILDVGTGTGILAIAALRLGAQRAVAVDNDEWAYLNARENVTVNNVDAQVTIVQGELSDVTENDFTLVAANIQKNVIEPLLPQMRKKLMPGGILLLSGLLSADRDAITTSVCNAGFNIIEERTEREWLALAASSIPTP